MITITKQPDQDIRTHFPTARNLQVWCVEGDVQAQVMQDHTVSIQGGSPGQHLVLVKADGLDPELQHIQVQVGAPT
jgi:hypothetical protein